MTTVTPVEKLIDDQAQSIYDPTLPLLALHQRATITVQRGIIYLLVLVILVIAFGLALARFQPQPLDITDIQQCLSQPTTETMPAWTVNGCRNIEVTK